jgi:hypothetical protein
MWLRCTSSLSLLLLAGCAATSPPPQAVAPRAALLPHANEPEEGLESAFAPPAPAAKAQASLPEVVDRRAVFKEALARANAALGARRLDEAQAQVEALVRDAEELTGEERLRAGELSLKVALARGDAAEARAAALAWHAACGPERLDACRLQAAQGLAQVGKVKGANASQVQALAQALQSADTCAAQSEQAQRPAPCAAVAEGEARARRDPVVPARLALARALAEKNDARRAVLLMKAEAACHTRACAPTRHRALSALSAHALAQKDLEGAVTFALLDAHAAASASELEARPYLRPASLDALCAQYDAAKGPRACRRLEKERAGGWTFRDFSRDRAGAGLPADQVKAVNEHFAPLLDECLEAQAHRMTPPDAQRFEVRWTVLNDGRVTDAHLRRDQDDSELARCLRAQFSTWRYPRYDGEYQHVTQTFTVTAVERYTPGS